MSDTRPDLTVPAPAGRPAAVRAGPGAASRQAPPFLSAAMRVFDLSLGQMLWSRRTIFLALIVGVAAGAGRPVPRPRADRRRRRDPDGRRRASPGRRVFGGMIWLLYLRFIVPVLGVFYGTALIADEVDDKTITYLFVRPIPRGAVLVGKYLAYLRDHGVRRPAVGRHAVPAGRAARPRVAGGGLSRPS